MQEKSPAPNGAGDKVLHLSYVNYSRVEKCLMVRTI